MNFGMDGMLMSYGKQQMKSSEMVETVFVDSHIKWILEAGVNKVEDGLAHYENLKGEYKTKLLISPCLFQHFLVMVLRPSAESEKTLPPSYS